MAAMQAARVDRKLAFRDGFTAVGTFFSLLALLIRVGYWHQALSQRFAAAWRKFPTEPPTVVSDPRPHRL